MAFSAGAAAQQYKWTDKDGKVRYGDTPPPGVKAKRLGGASAPAAAAPAPAPDAGAAKSAAAKASSPARKGPLTPAEQEAEFLKRRLDAEKEREKAAKLAEEAEGKRVNCTNARTQLRLLESGERILKTDAKGERYYVEDSQRAAETERARKNLSDWCG